jgi:hypothetical protein
MMIRWFARRGLDKFERDWDYDVSYLREILDEVGVAGLQPLQAMQKLAAVRRGVPVDVYCAAAITSAIMADCGPCAQLGVTMAERQGVDPSLLRTLARGDRDALPSHVRPAVDLARGALLRDGSGDEAREEILRRWGRRGLVTLSAAIVAAQTFPTFKYALGYGRACVRLRVAGDEVPVRALVPA